MHFGLGHSLVFIALVASIWLVVQGGDRLFPVLALVASGLEAAIGFGVISLSIAKYRIDVILPALLAVAAVMCWTRATAKGAVTAATCCVIVGAVQLVVAFS